MGAGDAGSPGANWGADMTSACDDSPPIIIQIDGEAVPFARAGSNGTRRFTKPRQAEFMNRVRDAGKRAMGGLKPLEGPLLAQMRFYFVAPASWSKKKREAALWVSSRPDLDNYVKCVLDSLGRRVETRGKIDVVDDCVFIDDAQVCDLEAQKRYGHKAQVIVTVSELGISTREVVA